MAYAGTAIRKPTKYLPVFVSQINKHSVHIVKEDSKTFFECINRLKQQKFYLEIQIFYLVAINVGKYIFRILMPYKLYFGLETIYVYV